jgi:hypothetical protein
VATVIAHGVNEPFERLFSPHFLRNTEVLHALRISPDRYRMPVLVDTGDGRRTVILEATLTAGQALQGSR